MTWLPEVSDHTWAAVLITAALAWLLLGWASWMGGDRDDDDHAAVVVEPGPRGAPRIPDPVRVLAWDRDAEAAVHCPTHGVIGYMTLPQAMTYRCPRCTHDADQATAADRVADTLTPDLEALDRSLDD